MFRYALWSFSGVFRGRNGGYSEGYSETIYAKNGQFYRLDGSDSAGGLDGRLERQEEWILGTDLQKTTK